MQPRPTSVTVFGILNIAFGAMAILSIGFSAVVLMFVHNPNDPTQKLMAEIPAYGLWMKISLVLGLLGTIPLILSGIGLLRLKSWGRITAVIYAVYTIVVGLLAVAVNAVLLFGPLMEKAHHSQGAEAALAIVPAASGTICGCFGLIYPVLLLIFMMRRNVVTAFRPAGTPPAVP